MIEHGGLLRTLDLLREGRKAPAVSSYGSSGDTHTYIYIYTHISIYLFMYLSIFIYNRGLTRGQQRSPPWYLFVDRVEMNKYINIYNRVQWLTGGTRSGPSTDE